MTSAELVRQTQMLDRPSTAAEIRAQVNLIQEVMKAVMLDGVHYGTIPGTPKPTLYKAGSEKILSTFHIAVEPVVTDLSVPGEEARFRVETRATSQSSGAYLGSGIGEASSSEEKYKWRGIVCQEEWDETAEDRRRKVWKRGQGGVKAVLQVRTQPADVANTILKMAKKRSQIDVTLTVTAASDVFAQDIEDLPEEMRDIAQDDASPARLAKPAIQPPQRKSATIGPKPVAGAGTVIRVKVVGFLEPKTGSNDKGPWTKYFIKASDGKTYGTFSKSDDDLAHEAQESGQELDLSVREGKYGPEITAAVLVERQPGDEQ